MTFAAKRMNEVEFFGWDFSQRLDDAEVLTGGTLEIAVESGTDPDPSSMLIGAAVVTPEIAKHLIGAGVNGTTYRLTATVSTSRAQTFVESDTLAVTT